MVSFWGEVGLFVWFKDRLYVSKGGEMVDGCCRGRRGNIYTVCIPHFTSDGQIVIALLTSGPSLLHPILSPQKHRHHKDPSKTLPAVQFINAQIKHLPRRDRPPYHGPWQTIPDPSRRVKVSALAKLYVCYLDRRDDETSARRGLRTLLSLVDVLRGLRNNGSV